MKIWFTAWVALWRVAVVPTFPRCVALAPILCLLPALGFASPPATDSRGLHRHEVLERLAETNPEIARVRDAIERARSAVQGSRGVLDPVLDAQLQLSHSQTPTASGLSSGIARDERYNASAGISRVFAPGTRLAMTFSQTISRSTFPLSVGMGIPDQEIEYGPNWGSQLMLELSQPLLRGRGRAVVLLAEAMALQEVRLREREAMRVAEDAALEALVAYVELRHAGEEVRVRQHGLQRTLTQLEVVENEIQAGQLAPIERDRVLERVALREESLLVARADASQRSRALSRVIGEAALGGGDYQALDPFHTGTALLANEELCLQAARQSSEVLALEEQARIARLRGRGAEDALRPNLSVSVGLSQNGLSEEWGESFGQLFTFHAPTYFGGLIFSMPLRNRAAQAEAEGARMDLSTAESLVTEARRVLCFEIVDALRVMEMQRERQVLAQRRIDIATRALEAEQARFAAGLSTVQAGLDAVELLEEAELAALRVQADTENAWWRLERLRGRILEAGQSGP